MASKVPRLWRLYDRDFGCRCHALPWDELPRGQVSELALESELEWCWHVQVWNYSSIVSPTDFPVAPELEVPNLHGRELTRLMSANREELDADLEQRGYDVARVWVSLVGYDAGMSELLIDRYYLKLRQCVDNFASFEEGPIRVVYLQWSELGSVMRLVYDTHRNDPRAKAFREGLGPRADEQRKRRYADAPIQLNDFYRALRETEEDRPGFLRSILSFAGSLIPGYRGM